MKPLLKYWNDFWFSKAELVPVGIFRIAFGFFLCVIFIAYLPNWGRFYDVNGIISLQDKSIPHYHNPLSIFYLTDGKIPVIFLWCLGFISAICFTVGYKTRIFTIVLYVLYTSMINRNYFIVYGEDNLIRMLLFYSCFAPLCCRFSIDSYLNKKIKSKTPEIWPIRLIQINIVLVYLFSAPYKLLYDLSWVNGEAIYWTVTSNNWSRFPFPDLFYQCGGLLSKMVTYGALLIEFSFPVLVWFRKTRLLALVLISALHIGIGILIPNVTFFTTCMLCSFWVFVPEKVPEKFLRKIKLLH